MLYSGLVSECIFFFECKPRPEPEPAAALAGLGSELGLEIYQARALKSQAKPGRHITSYDEKRGILTHYLRHCCLKFAAPNRRLVVSSIVHDRPQKGDCEDRLEKRPWSITKGDLCIPTGPGKSTSDVRSQNPEIWPFLSTRILPN